MLPGEASSILVPAIVSLLVSSCYASRDAPGASGIVVIKDNAKCEEMAPCSIPQCTEYCVSIGLLQKGFCTFKPDFEFYCCCSVVVA